MRKMILAVVNLLLLLYVITHFVSLRQYGEMRTLMGRFPSDEILVGRVMAVCHQSGWHVRGADPGAGGD